MDIKKKNTKSQKKEIIESDKIDSINLTKVETKISTDGTVKRKRNRHRKSLKKVDANIENVNTNSSVVSIIKTDSELSTEKNFKSSLKIDNIVNNEINIISSKILSNPSKDLVKNLQTTLKPANAPVESKESVVQSSNMQPAQVEKSREEVKAEREAKKLAKQLAKNKKKDISSDGSLKENIDDKKINVQNKTTEEKIVAAKPATEKKLNVDPIVTEKPIKQNVVLKPKNKKETLDTTLDKSTIDQCEVVKNDDADATTKTAEGEKSKSELRAERRAKQEAQRIAKTQLQAVKTKEKIKKENSPKSPKADSKKLTTSDKSKSTNIHHKVKLFNHLYTKTDDTPVIPLNSQELHPSIVRLGVKYSTHTVIGSNARCIALLNTLKQIIDDYKLPPNEEFSRGFEAHLAPCIKFLALCRPLAVSMINALKHVKLQLTQLANTISEDKAKSKLKEEIDTFISNQIDTAGEGISNSVNSKISDGDVILTYGCSSLIEYILEKAIEKGEKKFRVVVVVANPWNEGREMLRRLSAKGIKCSLVMISALSFIMREINIVVLGAGALLANGYVMARAGTAQVALVANAHNVPVLVCCETYKFSERVQTDSFVYNEIGNPDDLVKSYSPNAVSPLVNWRELDTLTPLNLMYDVTPPELVTAVVTERAVMPCTSVPVILRLIPEV